MVYLGGLESIAHIIIILYYNYTHYICCSFLQGSDDPFEQVPVRWVSKFVSCLKKGLPHGGVLINVHGSVI